MFGYILSLLSTLLFAGFWLTTKFIVPFFDANLGKQQQNEVTDNVDVVVMMPVYNEPLELILQQIQVLQDQTNGLERVHLVIAQEGKFWDEKNR